MDRRHFISTVAGVGASAVLFNGMTAGPALGQSIRASGTDMTGWRTVLGDGVWTGPGQASPTIADLRTTHLGTHSMLEANIHERGVMAHNIAFNRFTIDDGMTVQHRASTDFRIPVVPSDADWTYNSQTLEIGMFVWDGPNTRADYGLAIQWVLNPWIEEFGQIRAWTMTDDGPAWAAVDYLEPDTEWHTFDCIYRPNEKARVRLDDKNRVSVDQTMTSKDPDWGTTIDARFQVEIVSVWPGNNPSVPSHSAEFRNWKWMISP